MSHLKERVSEAEQARKKARQEVGVMMMVIDKHLG
jgi:hypothetical protein